MIKKFVIFTLLLGFACVAEAKISQTSLSHIRQRHWSNTKSGSSRFYPSINETKLNRLCHIALTKGSKRPSKNGKGRFCYRYKFKKAIGRTSSGSQAHTLIVITERNGDIVTAFPTQ
jgi:hypothetical protein